MKSSVVFKVDCKTELGESVYLIGSTSELKAWSTTNPIILKLTDQNIWESPGIHIPGVIEYKFFKKNINGEIIWEWGKDKPNRVLQINSGLNVEIVHTFGISHEEIIIKKKFKYSEYDDQICYETPNIFVIV